MIESTASFIKYFESIRRRTVQYIRAVPEDRLDWAPKAGEFTCGDLIRHLGASELMFAGGAAREKWRYPGHDRGPEKSLAELLENLEASHAQTIDLIGRIGDAELVQPRPSIQGTPVKTWRLLMAMVEHEVHHRSQLAVYLSLMGVEPPQIYGLGVEDVIALTTT